MMNPLRHLLGSLTSGSRQGDRSELGGDRHLRALSYLSIALAIALTITACGDSGDSSESFNGLSTNFTAPHVVKGLTISPSEEGYLVTAADSVPAISIVGDGRQTTIDREAFYSRVLKGSVPAVFQFEAPADGQIIQVPVEVTLKSYDTSARASTFFIKILDSANSSTKVSSAGTAIDGSSLKRVELPSYLDQATVIVQSCANSYVSCYGDMQCDGPECCPVNCGSLGELGKVGFCWSWGSFMCEPCQDYTSYCYSYGICAASRLTCPQNGCTTWQVPCSG